MKNNTYRHELKYLIDEPQQTLMRLKMQNLLEPDSHAKNGRYLIRSLYFDDLWNSAHSEKEDGILIRKKYRIRIYDYSDQVIRLERKKKFGAYIFKESAPLTREQVEKILEMNHVSERLEKIWWENTDFCWKVHGRFAGNSMWNAFAVECGPEPSWTMTGSPGSRRKAPCGSPLIWVFGRLSEDLIFSPPLWQPCRCWNPTD